MPATSARFAVIFTGHLKHVGRCAVRVLGRSSATAVYLDGNEAGLPVCAGGGSGNHVPTSAGGTKCEQMQDRRTFDLQHADEKTRTRSQCRLIPTFSAWCQQNSFAVCGRRASAEGCATGAPPPRTFTDTRATVIADQCRQPEPSFEDGHGGSAAALRRPCTSAYRENADGPAAATAAGRCR